MWDNFLKYVMYVPTEGFFIIFVVPRKGKENNALDLNLLIWVSLTDSNIVVKSGEIVGSSLVKKVFSDPKCILYVGGTLIWNSYKP